MKHGLVKVVSAEYVRGYQLRLRFTDGAEKVIDFSRWLTGEVFRPLTNKKQFKRFFIAGGTVCWPNGADIAPETLRNEADTQTAAQTRRRAQTHPNRIMAVGRRPGAARRRWASRPPLHRTGIFAASAAEALPAEGRVFPTRPR